MPALDFPANPVDGQSFTSNGITYYYNANISTWLTQLVNTNVGASSNTQVLFNDAGVSNGSSGFVFNKGSGYVGIGTGSLTAMLTVNTGTAGSVDIGPSASGAARIYSDSTGSFFGSYSNIPMVLRTNNTERMRITANGNLGIAYTNPDALNAKLYCYGYSGFGASNNGAIALGSRAYWTSTFENYSGNYGLGVNVNAATGLVRLQSQRFDGTATAYDIALQDLGGNVGIGTTSPTAARKLHVTDGSLRVKMESSSNNGYCALDMTSKDGSGVSTNIYAGMGIATAGAWEIFDQTNNQLAHRYVTGASGYHDFATQGLSRLLIDSNGQVIKPYQHYWWYTGGTTFADYTWVVAKPSSALSSHANYSTSTGLFTAPKAGKYLIGCFGLIYPHTSSTFTSAVWKNGAAHGQAVQFSWPNGSHTKVNITVVVSLALNDTVGFAFYRGGSDGANAYSSQWNQWGYFLG